MVGGGAGSRRRGVELLRGHPLPRAIAAARRRRRLGRPQESGIGAHILGRHTFGVRNGCYMALPTTMMIAALLHERENGLYDELTGKSMVVACAMASGGGLLMSLAVDTSLEAFLSVLPMGLLGCAVGMFRWIYLQNLFPHGEATTCDYTFKVAVIMLSATAACSAEISAFFDWPSYIDFVHTGIPHKRWLATWTLIGSSSAALVLLAELRLLPHISVSVIGLPLPACSTAAAALYNAWLGNWLEILGGDFRLPALWYVGLAVYVLSLWRFARVRWAEAVFGAGAAEREEPTPPRTSPGRHAAPAAPSLARPGPGRGYAPLPGGPRAPTRPRPPKRVTFA
ncbi:unnamed protein product [Prorocentrum cordatum]|nr:unnamed protein product [Polarella glacialis]